VTKRGLLPVALAASLTFPALAGSATTLMPGVTYDRQKRIIGGAPVVLHVVRAPSGGGLHRLRPVLSDGTLPGRRMVPSMQRGLAARATTVGVNGDFFHLASGRPSGLFLRGRILRARPNAHRSALAVGSTGTVVVNRFVLDAWWQAGSYEAHPLKEFNRRLTAPGVALFTPPWAARTPRLRGAVDVVFERFPRARLDRRLTGTVTRRRRGGGTAVPPGGAVLQARSSWRPILIAEAPRGTSVTVQLQMTGFPADAPDGIGGGPLLVRDGLPVREAGEWFSFDQLVSRHPRTAVGQLGNGRMLFVVVEGRSRYSRGLTNWQLAQTMAGLGAQTAMGLDGGGSSTLAVEGRVLNRPSDGVPRRVAEGLFVHYYGIYAPPRSRGVITPNGDGVGDRTRVSAKVVRPSLVDLRLVRPNGSIAWRLRKEVGRGTITRTVGAPRMRNGPWRWVVRATDSRTGHSSKMSRRFAVNKTLGFLRLSKERMRVVAGRGGRLRVSARLTRRARLAVTVRSSGVVRRVLYSGTAAPGAHSWLWNGRGARGKVVAGGVYTIGVRATNELGTVQLQRNVRVVRAPRS
jgi:Phosphodiester glycosidase